MTESSRALRANVPTVAAEDIDGEVVVVSFETGHYYSLRDTAADIWRLLEGGMPISLVVEQFDPSVAPAVLTFISSLQSESLMVTADANGRGGASPDQLTPYVTPTLERFEEMSEMLLYDPIHDVDDTGWPNLPDDSR